jgi:hypothetical protein
MVIWWQKYATIDLNSINNDNECEHVNYKYAWYNEKAE